MMEGRRRGPRAVLWDLDGVLVDTGELHFRAWEQTLAEAGIVFTRPMFQHTFGMNNAGILAWLLGQPPEPAFLTEIGDRKERRFRQAAPGQARLLPGVAFWLERLQARGYRQAVASSAPQANIEVLIAGLNIRPFFGALVSAELMPGKPDPAVFLEAARQLAIPPEQCVVIEDSLAGVEAARRAGMRCVAVTTTHPRAALSPADWVVESLEALPEGAF
jgi:HAD superfamily hydrolase (TIGR01509 family)